MKTVRSRDGSHRATVFAAPLLGFGIGSLTLSCLWWNAETGEDGLTGMPPFGQFLSLFSALSDLWILLGLYVGMTGAGVKKRRQRDTERVQAPPSVCVLAEQSSDEMSWPSRGLRPAPASKISLMLSWLTMLSWNTTTHGAAVRGWQTLMEMSSPR